MVLAAAPCFLRGPLPTLCPHQGAHAVRRLVVRLLAVPQDPHPLLAPSATICATFGGTGEGEDVAGASTGWQGRGEGALLVPPSPSFLGLVQQEGWRCRCRGASWPACCCPRCGEVEQELWR